MTVGRIPSIEGGIQPTLLTTTGDIMYASSASNPARLGIGTANQVLQVNSGATAPEWATISTGGMTLLSTTSLSGASTTISAISGAYVNLVAFVFGVTNATADGEFRIAPNGNTGISSAQNSNAASTVETNANKHMILNGGGRVPTRTNSDNFWAVTINNYASTTSTKATSIFGGYNSSSNGGFISGGMINTTSAITSLVFTNAGGNLSTGTVLLYGVK